MPTGIAIAIPEGFEAQVRPRSGLAARHGVTVLNSPGTIDADYRGEIAVLLINFGEEPFRIERGMRIAQLVVAPVTRSVGDRRPSCRRRSALPAASVPPERRRPRRLRAKAPDAAVVAQDLFAIEAVLDIAYHAGAQPVQSREITRRQGIPRRYLEQALQNLVRGGVLVGVRGPRGGYRLARERRRITVGEIIRAVRNDPRRPAAGRHRLTARPRWFGRSGCRYKQRCCPDSTA